jgi:hypothetical protein
MMRLAPCLVSCSFQLLPALSVRMYVPRYRLHLRCRGAKLVNRTNLLTLKGELFEVIDFVFTIILLYKHSPLLFLSLKLHPPSFAL